jgi:hypothetical protein
MREPVITTSPASAAPAGAAGWLAIGAAAVCAAAGALASTTPKAKALADKSARRPRNA